MHTFTDNAGRVWTANLNVATLKRVRALAGVDLASAISVERDGKVEASLLERLASGRGPRGGPSRGRVRLRGGGRVSLSPRTRTRLRRPAAKYETAAFIEDDPIRFLHTASGPGIETTAFVAACLSYGSRKQFLPNLKDDIHVLRQAQNLGLVRTNAATMHTALEITARLAEVFPGDPCKGDFALYGLGIDEEL